MEKQANSVSLKKKIEVGVILFFCAMVAVGVGLVLTLVYNPDQNSLGALGTVCMDVISMLVLIILIINLTLEKDELSTTTKLFLGLMLGTVFAMFFDFLTWSYDGRLAWNDYSFMFIVSSLVMGSVLAGMFTLYLGSYMDDMYNMKKVHISSKICLALNVVAFILALTLALSHQAFEIIDGHYQTGPLYDYVTVIPVFTLLYMTVYAVCHVKTIGIHDAVAVVGYIFTMIIGALIEAQYNIGATYVSIAVADIYIFVMLQNKLIDRVKKQRETLAEQITSQYAILKSMSDIYSHINYVDLVEMTARRFDSLDNANDHFDLSVEPHTALNKRLVKDVSEAQKEKFWEYTNLSTLSERMSGVKMISAEFYHAKEGWFRALYIRIGEDGNAPLEKVIYAIRNINEEKKNVEKWIQKSNTDELTRFYNRHAYEDDIAAISADKIKDNFVYISIDVNSLKFANDTLGHDAGDELIIGASDCLRQCLGSYGKLYRTGGDEFVALIYAEDKQLVEIINDLEEETESWGGKLNSSLTMAVGYVTRKEAGEMSLHDMAVLADKRMYDNKALYYQKKGIDRRGQRDAHVVLAELYTKILKANITDDTYQIISMDASERTSEMGFAKTLSQWLEGVASAGLVHPNDLEEYRIKTDFEYISNYFKNNKKALRVFYRRLIDDSYKQMMMEIIPTSDYTDNSQSIYLYVKNIEE